MNKKLLLFAKLFTFFIAIHSYSAFSFSIDEFVTLYDFSNYSQNTEKTFSIYLNNGDILSCTIILCIKNLNDAIDIMQNEKHKMQLLDSQAFEPFIIVNYFEEEIIIYEDEIMKITPKTFEDNAFMWQKHSLFLMPTANPISNNHYIGNYEIFLLNAGIGIYDYLSIMAAHSFIPFTESKHQITLINTKLSIPKIQFPAGNSIVLAAGINYTQVNADNKLWHLFGVATHNWESENPANFSIGMFYKTGETSLPSLVTLFERTFMMDYQNGAFGICAGIEKHFNTRKDLSLLLEIWNSDITSPTNSAVLLGFRLAGKKVHADFGLSVFTQPFFAPFFSFVWMPFN